MNDIEFSITECLAQNYAICKATSFELLYSRRHRNLIKLLKFWRRKVEDELEGRGHDNVADRNLEAPKLSEAHKRSIEGLNAIRTKRRGCEEIQEKSVFVRRTITNIKTQKTHRAAFSTMATGGEGDMIRFNT